MDQQFTFADSEFSNKRRQTLKEAFLGRMDKLIPWTCLETAIEPHYHKYDNSCRPYPLSTALRTHCFQQWYSIRGSAMECALLKIASMRLFAELSLDKAIPDHTIVLKYRHLLEHHGKARQVFEEVNQWLSEAGILQKEGSLIDATIIEAPCSTKSKMGACDRNVEPPAIYQTTKGNQWHIGIKDQIGVDVCTSLMHSFMTIAANEHYFNQADWFMHSEEAFIFADVRYWRAIKQGGLKDVSSDRYIVEQPGKLKSLKKHPRINRIITRTEYLKASIRAKVEHLFRIIKCQFGFVKVRYPGPKKNDSKLAMLIVVANIVRMHQMLRAQDSSVLHEKAVAVG